MKLLENPGKLPAIRTHHFYSGQASAAEYRCRPSSNLAQMRARLYITLATVTVKINFFEDTSVLIYIFKYIYI